MMKEMDAQLPVRLMVRALAILQPGPKGTPVKVQISAQGVRGVGGLRTYREDIDEGH